MQGAFRQVAVEADACAKELTLILKQRMVTQKDQAAECIQMVRKLGEPIESLQVLCFWLLLCLFVRELACVSGCLPPCLSVCLPACLPHMALCDLKRMHSYTPLLHMLSGAMSAPLFVPL